MLKKFSETHLPAQAFNPSPFAVHQYSAALHLQLTAMSVDKGIVIEAISAKNLGGTAGTGNWLLKMELGTESHKTSTKKHVGADVVWDGETLRFSKNAGDLLKVCTCYVLLS